tara:strand:- start:294 stop:473 length:180 start_codon:yes stop_codon:yes gene_type:complete
MSMPVIIEDIRPLVAMVAPFFGLIGILIAGEKRANLRELITFLPLQYRLRWYFRWFRLF